MEEYTPETETQEEKSEQLKRWFQDNLRIIISVAIVIIIAGGIYSYSKRTDSPIVADQEQATEENDTTTDEEKVADKTEEAKVTENKDTKPAVSPAQTSKETEVSFVETAGKGDGLTVLARRATANYLEKNQDSTLTKEHKIYIEDYLRKAVGQKGGVRVGTNVEFSKDLIQKAIAASKTLNENQLKNLQKYSARVSSL
ncbi:MAG: hypothetical protein US57_C0001G0007 [Candidatus Moranbacteria bacterium GW2011_GWC2_37_73]|nr:MAG: hypothetical protein UR95_C0001G0068 [Parcubacteria group bacterium GW2011_GWC1_36_108]KKQ00676.1 MAG: hypothetical protein US09_C0007G0007 [Candidatus Moranbacteria bacterium GW2011_GWD1_36_198]KKQ01544.1 MAG: hypothetical protein US10_C0011G0007 [Candidatus Moranbacteria bacterium GW2011_GWD2_36_198]KKQ40397.1 MAG: hypothetical protein US57_C0001G0007 [Candidatus Moranbacteria bacterium GW2011_GWC2_37_73]HAR99832.1 hypothetical protein [Candidatus Moranbacteria bacterium]